MTNVNIGIEVHVQLTSLKSKLFCGCSSDYRGREPNTLVCPVCLGLPGSLPVLNKRSVVDAIAIALALNAKIMEKMIFFRKNYFYPDMAKNFQITQYDKGGGMPLAVNGYIDIQLDNMKKRVKIRRIQIEEDPAKLTYLGSIDRSPYTLVDYNRAGIALVEIVTEPCLSSPREARVLLQKLRSILEHLGVSDDRLEGAMRCDANISLQEGKRVEVKNISSFKEVERALRFEVTRQRYLKEKGGEVKRETRHWDERRRLTTSLRTKESEQDYRYFPEPDLVPIVISKDMIEEIRGKMPELPDARMARFTNMYGLPPYDAEVLTIDKALADFFEECAKLYPDAKRVSNWMMTDLLRWFHEDNIEIKEAKISPENLVEMINLIDEGVISGKIAKSVLPVLVRTGRTAKEVIEEKGLIRISSRDKLEGLVDRVMGENPKAVLDAQKDEKAVHFLIGKLMRLTEGKADPQLSNMILKEKLEQAASE